MLGFSGEVKVGLDRDRCLHCYECGENNGFAEKVLHSSLW